VDNRPKRVTYSLAGELLTVTVETERNGQPAKFDVRMQRARAVASAAGLKEIKSPPEPPPSSLIAIVGGRLIDGRGADPVENSVVVVRGSKIVAAGAHGEVRIPEEAQRFDAQGLSILPGLFDSHFHSQHDVIKPVEYELKNGITSFRDPGHPLRFYNEVLASENTMPRVFLTGAHLDAHPPAHPTQAIVITDAEHAARTVHEHVDAGASAIKIYMRLPVEHIAAACEAAKRRGVLVTAHLELVDADAAIGAGLRGIEHITSFGTALAEAAAAAKFKTTVAADSAARHELRHWLWSTIDLDTSPRVQPLLDLIVKHDVFVSPTLAVFEKRAGDKGASDADVRGFLNMLKFTGLCHQAGAKIVVGSHTRVPHGEVGRAYQRELELLVEAGMSPREVITAATLNGAVFFGAEERLGTIAPGKLADLVLIEGDPLRDVRAMKNVRRVMLNGVWQNEGDK
jgi:imidazolonepropionase-like amidohydrolase